MLLKTSIFCHYVCFCKNLRVPFSVTQLCNLFISAVSRIPLASASKENLSPNRKGIFHIVVVDRQTRLLFSYSYKTCLMLGSNPRPFEQGLSDLLTNALG